MQGIINRLDKLATISKYVRLYKNFDKIIIFKNMGKISGEVDRPYIDFLIMTNGASVLDYCFMGFKNKSLGLNLDENISELRAMDYFLSDCFWGCISDSIGNSFGYVDKKNKLGGHYFGYHSMSNLGHIHLVASSFSIFMDKFLSQIEAAVSKNKDAIGLDNNDWFMEKDALFKQDDEIADFLKDKQDTEYHKCSSCS
jgi:hypothetical protein